METQGFLSKGVARRKPQRKLHLIFDLLEYYPMNIQWDVKLLILQFSDHIQLGSRSVRWFF